MRAITDTCGITVYFSIAALYNVHRAKKKGMVHQNVLDDPPGDPGELEKAWYFKEVRESSATTLMRL